MNYIYIILACLIASFGVYFQATINQLERENVELSTSLQKTIQANETYKVTMEQIQKDYVKGLETLADLSQKKEKEIRYVTTVKERIIHDQNSTCIDAVNAVFARLHSQRNADNNASTNAKD